MFQSDSGRTVCVRPLRHNSVAPGMQKAKAPTKGLSELNSMAFGLAVYASWSELPQYHAKLASSCWSGSTEQGSHLQGSDERFQSCKLHLIPLSQACLAQLHRLRQNEFHAKSHRCIRPMTELHVENGASEVLESRLAKVRRCTSPP